MIIFENTSIYGWEAAIRGMRNPLKSWDKSDSVYGTYWGDIDGHECSDRDGFSIGSNDLDLMKKLIAAGPDHSKFMRMITVTVDITAPLYWWKEFDTYKVGTVRNSCSTMHKIHSNEFTLDDFSHEYIDKNCFSSGVFNEVIRTLNFHRKMYLKTKDKKLWWQMIQLLPSSYNQRATVQLNYAVLRNMYHSRTNHKLDEWSQGFTKWVKSLPYSELITAAHCADENKRMKEQIEQLIKEYEQLIKEY